MALLLGGQRNQDWINRGARERAFTRFAAAGFFALLGVVVFETAALVYVGSLPREKAVVVAQQRDGSYQPYAENVTPNQAGITMLLGNWVAAWRLGSNDARSARAPSGRSHSWPGRRSRSGEGVESKRRGRRVARCADRPDIHQRSFK